MIVMGKEWVAFIPLLPLYLQPYIVLLSGPWKLKTHLKPQTKIDNRDSVNLY